MILLILPPYINLSLFIDIIHSFNHNYSMLDDDYI
jgi:hypothetical protein